MLDANFWKDKSFAQKVIKEKKLYEDLVISYEKSIKDLDDLDELYNLALHEDNTNVQNELLKNINEKLVDGAQWIYGDKTSGRSLLNFETDREIIDNYRTQMENNKVIHKDMQLKESALLDMKFDVDNGWGAGHSETTLRELMDKKNEVSKFHDSGYKKAFCNLAMPNEFQYDYSANWNNTFKLGTMALAADDPQRAAAILTGGATIGMLSSGIAGFLSKENKDGGLGLGDIAGIADGAKNGVMKAGDFFGVNSNITDPTNIAGMAGLAPNENAIQFFKKMDFRQFDLTFEFASRNADESKEIQKILQWFKEGMHPVSKDPRKRNWSITRFSRCMET